MKCQSIYSFFDRNGDNKIPISLLKQMLISYGVTLTNQEAHVIM